MVGPTLLTLATGALAYWLKICSKRYIKYIKNIECGNFKIAYLHTCHAGMYKINNRNSIAKVGVLEYKAPDKNGDITTYTARIPDKYAKMFENKVIGKAFVISMDEQMEGMGVILSEQNVG